MKKKLLYFFHVIYIFEKIALKMKLLRLHYDDFLASYFEIKKTRVLMQKKVLLTQNDKKYKRIRTRLRYVLKN